MSLNTIPNLGNVITSAAARKAIYAAYGIIAFVVAAIQVGYSATPDTAQPTWLTVTLAVVAFAGTAIGGLAVANSPTSGEVVQSAVPVTLSGRDIAAIADANSQVTVPTIDNKDRSFTDV